MSIIVNDPRNLPVTILVTDINMFEKNGIPEVFLRQLLSNTKNEVGKETEKHYIMATDVMLRFQYPKFMDAFIRLRKLMDNCDLRNYKFIMINKRQ